MVRIELSSRSRLVSSHQAIEHFLPLVSEGTVISFLGSTLVGMSRLTSRNGLVCHSRLNVSHQQSDILMSRLSTHFRLTLVSSRLTSGSMYPPCVSEWALSHPFSYQSLKFLSERLNEWCSSWQSVKSQFFFCTNVLYFCTAQPATDVYMIASTTSLLSHLLSRKRRFVLSHRLLLVLILVAHFVSIVRGCSRLTSWSRPSLLVFVSCCLTSNRVSSPHFSRIQFRRLVVSLCFISNGFFPSDVLEHISFSSVSVSVSSVVGTRRLTSKHLSVSFLTLRRNRTF